MTQKFPSDTRYIRSPGGELPVRAGQIWFNRKNRTYTRIVNPFAPDDRIVHQILGQHRRMTRRNASNWTGTYTFIAENLNEFRQIIGNNK